MQLTFATRELAQARQDKIFADMQDKLESGTTSWDVPYQDVDKDGKPLDTLWHITVDYRVRGVLTPEEIATFPEWTN